MFDQSAPAVPADESYCRRLSDVFASLSKRHGGKLLLAELPCWAPKVINPAVLQGAPRLQAEVAAATAYTPSKWLLEQELARRDSIRGNGTSWEDEGELSVDVYDAADEEELHGLCFSGGGIRSATFCLGILQAFAQCRVLDKFDYLSTVSGGGYIHQWLASWIATEPGRFKKVQERLVPNPEPGSQARAPEQITWLRRYSSYLTPQTGLLSLDTWTVGAIWLRNTFLNQIVLFSFLATSLLIIRGMSHPFMRWASPASPGAWAGVLLGLVVATSCVQFSRALVSVTGSSHGIKRAWSGALGSTGVACWLVLPGFGLTLLLVLEAMGALSLGRLGGYPTCFFLWAVHLAGVVLAVTFGGLAAERLVELKPGSSLWAARLLFLGSGLLCAALPIWLAWQAVGRGHAGGGPLQATAIWFADRANTALTRPAVSMGVPVHHPAIPVFEPEILLALFAPAFFFFLLFIAIRLQVGVMGRFYVESRREWLARFGAWCGIVAAGWICLGSIARLGPVLCGWATHDSARKQLYGWLVVVATHAVTLYAGGSSKTDGKPKSGGIFGYTVLDLVGIIGAPLCILSLLVIVAGLLHWALEERHLGEHPLVFTAATLAILLFFGFRVDVNEFSLHPFYRNRLARCYLGATNRNRTPDPFTGFDDHIETTGREGAKLSNLRPVKFGGPPGVYDGPFPIFCATINLTFGEDLAWQERKGASFAFTPLYSGYHVGWTMQHGYTTDTTFNGYVRTAEYAYPEGGIELATVAAISGAALSPNQGFSSKPALAFLMTLFNVRLGWWLANTRKPKVWPSDQHSPTPWFGLWYLLRELFGLADDTSNYVCLSDGGRFENMGVYELVRRRCRLIVICDGEQDTNTSFEGIGNAIAKCRTDFGAEIDLNLDPLIPDEDTKISKAHFVVGTIRYPAPPGSDRAYRGKVIYLKTSITGKEPGDLLHHKRACPDFPQDTTLNQWFTETQFESYRRLGQQIGWEACPHVTMEMLPIAEERRPDPYEGSPGDAPKGTAPAGAAKGKASCSR